MKRKLLLHLFTAIMVLLSMNAAAQTEYEGTSNIQFLYGEDIKGSAPNLITITQEHVGSYGAFEHFGFADILYNTKSENINIYTEWYPKIGLGQATGRDMETGILKEVLLGVGMNALIGGDDFFVFIAGPVFQFGIPGFDFFQLETYYYRQNNPGNGNGNGIATEYEGTYQITPAWDVPIPITERLKFRTRGFADFIGDRGPGTSQIITQPQLLLDMGALWNKPGKLFTGTEWRYWHNVGGVADQNESILQFEVMLQF